MTGRVQTLRSNVAGNRPTGRQPGELYVNWADGQFGAISSVGAPQDLIGVTFYSTTASYVVGQFVIQAGQLYRCTVANAPGAFNPAQWSQIGGSVSVADVAPANPQSGTLWWDSVGGQLYVLFNDGNSTQWVVANNPIPGPPGVAGPAGPTGPAGPNTLPPGVTDGSNAAAGQIGEFQSASNTTGAPVTSTVRSNVVSIALPAGDWDVWGAVYFALTTGSSTNMQGWISPVSNSLPSGYGGVPGTVIMVGAGFTNGCQLNTGTVRYSLTATTTLYLGVYNNFTGGTCTVTGTIMARRAR
jgi:hypothetical protein